jgi:hypothetical protein
MARKWDRNKFNIWMRKVDDEIASYCGLSHYDLADFLYADAFIAGRTPKAVAKSALRAEGYPF